MFWLDRELARWCLNRQKNDHRLLPILRFWVFCSLLQTFGLFALIFVASGPSIRELFYTWLVSLAMTFVIFVAAYAMYGWMNGRAGFEKSIRKSIVLLLGVCITFMTAVYFADSLTNNTLPNLYMVFAGVGFPCLLFLGAWKVGPVVASAMVDDRISV